MMIDDESVLNLQDGKMMQQKSHNTHSLNIQIYSTFRFLAQLKAWANGAKKGAFGVGIFQLYAGILVFRAAELDKKIYKLSEI